MGDFKEYVQIINQYIEKDINKNIKDPSLLEAIDYCLKDGKRWRPILFLSIFETSKIEKIHYPTLSDCFLFLEYIHNASLIVDDLPMMDNDDYRRNKLTLHKQFDESTSKLAALQLMLLSLYKIQTMLVELKKKEYFTSHEMFLEFTEKINHLVYSLLGNNGLCVGQLMDLKMKESTNLEEWLDMVYKKTGSLFILSISLGYILSRKTTNNLEEIMKIGEYFGYIYQILDDLEDFETDKKKQYHNNILFYVNREEANKMVQTYFTDMINLINKYNLGCITLKNISKLLKLKWLKTKTIT